MPEFIANIVAKTDDPVTFTFTPQDNGYAKLTGAGLYDSTGKQLQQWPGQNVIQFKAPNGKSLLIPVYSHGPSPETWSLSYATAGVTTPLWSGLSIDTTPSSLTVFGT